MTARAARANITGVEKPNRLLRSLVALTALGAACALAAVAWLAAHERGRTADSALISASYEELTGSVFSASAGASQRGPRTKVLDVPDFEGATAIWGSTGRDRRGHLWFGFSASGNGGSARLYEFDPQGEAWHERGRVVDRLRAIGMLRPGEGQNKIHSRIVGGSDGWLYFCSSDEEGEREDGSALPRWGGHLWRVDPETGKWQHLLATPEALIAASAVGRYVYALGYWGHLLVQYDTLSGTHRKLTVGSLGGHVSRNLISDLRGHVFVPRVQRDARGQPSATLVEFDTGLRQIAATPLQDYLGRGDPADSHGITGLAYLPDGRIAFLTGRGGLYLIERDSGAPADRPARVRALGWVHPDGEAPATGLFSLGDAARLAAIVSGKRGHEWVVSDLRTGASSAHPIDVKDLREVLLYGSVARDNAGNAYAVGWRAIPRGKGPLVLRIEP